MTDQPTLNPIKIVADFLTVQGETLQAAVMGASIFVIIWQYTQKSAKGCCFASQAAIAAKAHCSPLTVRRYRDLLIQHNLIIDRNPGLRHKPHTCYLTDLGQGLIERTQQFI